jgi:hypothetical protein
MAVTYNDGVRFCVEDGDQVILNSNGNWIARVPVSQGCIIEVTEPCRVRNIPKGFSKEGAIRFVAEHITSYDGSNYEELTIIKRALRDYDARTGIWIR